MTRYLVALFAVLLFVGVCMPLGAQTWDNAVQFSSENNPNGPWTYGYLDEKNNFKLYNSTIKAGEGISGWALDSDPDAAGNVTVNTTNEPIERFGIRWEPGQVLIHPGLGTYRAVIRWTSPVSAKINLRAFFKGQSKAGAPANIEIRKNGTTIYTGTTQGFTGQEQGDGRIGSHPDDSFSELISVRPGDVIDLMADAKKMQSIGHVSVDVSLPVSKSQGASISGLEFAPEMWSPDKRFESFSFLNITSGTEVSLAPSGVDGLTLFSKMQMKG